MAKQTPFFKFDSLSWLGGSIQFTDLASKGLFIDLCALYWESQKPVKIDTKFKVRIRCDEGTLTNLLGTLSDLDIIIQSEHGITVPFLDSLMSDRNEWLEKCSNAGKKSATNKGTSSNKKEESRKKNEESRDKKEIKSKPKTKVFIPPTLLEVKAFFVEKGYLESAGEKAFNYYDLADWVDGKGNKVKNWKQKMNGVWFKEENLAKPQQSSKEFDPNTWKL